MTTTIITLSNRTPDEQYYSVIWCQWVLPYLTDDDLVLFFERCIPALTENGMIIVKENISTEGSILDHEDTSVTRTDEQYRTAFEKAGLRLVAEKLQTGFPKQLFPVRMYALKPRKSKAKRQKAQEEAEIDQLVKDIMSDE